MMPISRRQVLGGAGLAGAAAATGAGVDRLISSGTGYHTDEEEPMTDDEARTCSISALSPHHA
jgi:oxalate decarboxylase